jgi:glycogen(starch) synthase
MIEKMLTDQELRERLTAEAREHVLDFDWSEVARETAAVYEALAAAVSAGS